MNNNKLLTLFYLLEAKYDVKLTNYCRDQSPGHLIWCFFNQYYTMGINTYFFSLIYTRKLVTHFIFYHLLDLPYMFSGLIITIFISCRSVAQGLKNIRMDDLGTTVPYALKNCNLWHTKNALVLDCLTLFPHKLHGNY